MTIIYQDSEVTITNEFIRSIYTSRETIPITSLEEVRVSRKVEKDYKDAAVLFFILGILSIWFLIGFLFLAWGIAASFYKKYSYSLEVISRGDTLLLKRGTSQGKLKSVARTIRGLHFSIAEKLKATA